MRHASDFVIVWDPDVMSDDDYSELVVALGDLIRADGGIGIERVQSYVFPVGRRGFAMSDQENVAFPVPAHVFGAPPVGITPAQWTQLLAQLIPLIVQVIQVIVTTLKPASSAPVPPPAPLP